MVSKDRDIVCSNDESVSRCLCTPGRSSDSTGQKDYDGDNFPFELLLDDYMARKAYPLSQRFNMMGLVEPYQTSDFNSIPKPLVANLAQWIAA